MVISWPAALPPAVQPSAEAPDIRPKPCTLHGTGWAESTPILLAPNEPARVQLVGVLATGVEWSDVPPAGSGGAAAIDVARGGVRIHAFARLGERLFWLSRKSGSLDGIASVRPSRKVKALGVEDGEAIVEIEDWRVRPSRVVGTASCDDLGTDASVTTPEAPLRDGGYVRPVRGRWVHFLAQPNGPALRTVDASTAELRTAQRRGGFFYAYARLDNVDVEGWVAASEIHTPNGGVGMLGARSGMAVVGSRCGGSPSRQLKANAELRLGTTGASSVRLGEIIAGTNVLVRTTEGDLARIEIPPCELVPLGGEALWVASSALD